MTPPAKGEPTGHLDENELAAFLDRDLAPDEIRRIEAHLDACPDCRAELVAMRRLLDAYAVRSRRSRVVRRWAIPVAIAAGLALLLLVPQARVRRSGESERGSGLSPTEGRAGIAVVAPADNATVAAGGVVLTWHSTGAELYRVVLLSRSGEPLWTHETSDTSVAIPASVALAKGGTYFWRVDAIANGITASTGARLLKVSR